jgi:hypothetical protein
MSTPSSSLPIDRDNGILASVMPNRGRTKFLRGAAGLFLIFGVIGSISVGVDALLEFHARHSWPIAQGIVIAQEVKSNQDVPANLSRHTTYWAEFEVRFSVPADQCLTGTIYDNEREPMRCGGIIRTRPTDSPRTAYSWLSRHLRNSAVGILHDPNGPDIKIAGESRWLVYRWDKVLVVFVWVAVFLPSFLITQRRLRYLQMLPEDYDASPPASSPPAGPDDLIDLKLS